VVLSPKAERPRRVRLGLGVSPGRVDDVALELRRGLVVGHFHELRGGDLEEHRDA